MGSAYYVSQLTKRELKGTAVMLNFDMIGSPNAGWFVYDGDASDTASTGSTGSGVVENVFVDFFKSIGRPTEPTAFDGRSDYDAFVAAGSRGWPGAVRRPIWATAAVKLGGRPFGELRPALAWRDELRESGGALDGVRALPAKGKNFSFRGCIRRLMGHPPGPTTCTAVRGEPQLREKVVSCQRMTKARQGDLTPCHF